MQEIIISCSVLGHRQCHGRDSCYQRWNWTKHNQRNDSYDVDRATTKVRLV